MSPTSGLFKFHRPKPNINEAPIPTVSDESRRSLRNLGRYRSNKTHHTHVPRACRAAVLVTLFVGRHGDLYVLLSRRASTLRSYAGDTSLPGGKVEHADRTIEDTARREAFEEIGLPLDKLRVPLLCVLDPFLAGDSLVVTPVVVLILDNTLRPILNTPEVASLFSHPLHSFLSTTSPFPMDPLPAPEFGAEHPEHRDYYTYVDIAWPTGFQSNKGAYQDIGPAETKINLEGSDRRKARRPARGHVRQHRFLTGREAGGVKPVFGLTAAILIQVASIAYARPPEFPVRAQDQPSMRERIEWAVAHSPRMREAKEREDEESKTSRWSSGTAKLSAREASTRQQERLESDLLSPSARAAASGGDIEGLQDRDGVDGGYGAGGAKKRDKHRVRSRL